MISQAKLAIIAILIVIPLGSFAVYATDSKIQQSNTNSKLLVMSSFYPLYEFAKTVGQEHADVILLVPAGVEPHDWEPTIQDVQRMQKADMIIINGLGFENWVDHLSETNFHVNIVDTSIGILESSVIEIDASNTNEHAHKSGDPHIWLNPIFAKIQVQNIADAFSTYDPSNEKFYQKNAQNYKSELDILDAKIRTELSGCSRDFITFHDSFSFFADEYNLNQHAIISSNDPHAEPTARTLGELINTANKLNLKIIFTEETANPRISQVIADEIDGKILALSPLEISDDGTYISKMTENLNSLKEALC